MQHTEQWISEEKEGCKLNSKMRLKFQGAQSTYRRTNAPLLTKALQATASRTTMIERKNIFLRFSRWKVNNSKWNIT